MRKYETPLLNTTKLNQGKTWHYPCTEMQHTYTKLRAEERKSPTYSYGRSMRPFQHSNSVFSISRLLRMMLRVSWYTEATRNSTRRVAMAFSSADSCKHTSTIILQPSQVTSPVSFIMQRTRYSKNSNDNK